LHFLPARPIPTNFKHGFSPLAPWLVGFFPKKQPEFLKKPYICPSILSALPRRILYNKVSAFFLAALLTTFWSLKVAHGFLWHDAQHRHDKPVCAAAQQRETNVVHLHDERFSADDCTLCGFVLSATELPQLPEFAVRALTASIGKPVLRRPQRSGVSILSTRLRGPPVLKRA
jgi:hypothetical protein